MDTRSLIIFNHVLAEANIKQGVKTFAMMLEGILIIGQGPSVIIQSMEKEGQIKIVVSAQRHGVDMGMKAFDYITIGCLQRSGGGFDLVTDRFDIQRKHIGVITAQGQLA